MKETTWHGCYEGGWHGGLITPESFSHPAKFSGGLIRRIYEHLRDHYGLPAGSVVVDPFGGVALGALDAMECGYAWVGVELERRFWWLGAGGDCPGFTREDWRQYYSRGARIFDGFGLCPDCQKAWQPDGYDCRCDYGMFYRREIPHREPHHFTGNLDLFRKGRPGAQAVLVHGDSRELRRHVGEAGCVVGSPPFLGEHGGAADASSMKNMDRPGRAILADGYGTTDGQLGSMRPGSLDAVVSSPPYAESIGNENQIDYSKAKGKHDGLKPSIARDALGGPYGTTDGNLGNLKAGSVEAVVGSPPFSGGRQPASVSQPGGRQGVHYREVGSNELDNFGHTPGQLASLPAGSVEAACDAVDAVVGSPPFEESNAKQGNQQRGGGKRMDEPGDTFVHSPENLGNATGGTFWEAALQIVRECHAILRPGGFAVWVLKSFVRASKIVDFPGDWRRLCESCGFELVEEIHASLVKVDEHPGLFGEPVVKTKARKSFFRRLHEAKRPDLAIDFEVVLFMRKPAGTEALH